jgi:hypothetical protein
VDFKEIWVAVKKFKDLIKVIIMGNCNTEVNGVNTRRDREVRQRNQ